MAAAALALSPADRRPDGPTLLPLPARPAKAAAAEEFGTRDILNALRYHLILFLTLGTLLAVAFGFAGWSLFPAKYTTYSMLFVDSTEQTVAETAKDGFSRTDFGTFLSTQAAVIKSHKIMNWALGQPVPGGRTLKQLPMLDTLDDPISFLEEKVTVEFSDKSQIMKVMMSGGDPVQITQIVNAVTDVFIKEVETNRKYKQAHLDKLVQAKSAEEKSLEEMQKAYQSQFRPVAGNEATLKNKQARVARYVQLLNDGARLANDVKRVREQLAEAEAQQRQADESEVVVPELAALVDADPAVAKKTADLNKIETYVVNYARNALNKNSEYIQSCQRRAEKERGELEELKKQARERIKRTATSQQTLPGSQVEVMKLQRLLRELQREERLQKEELVKFADLAQEEAAAGPPAEQLILELKLRNQQETVGRLDRLAKSLATELKADDRVKIYEKAHEPQQKEIKKQVAFTGVGAFAGFALVGGLITLGEARKKRIYSAQDPVFGRLPLVGRIPEHGFVPPASGADPAGDDAAGQAFREAVDRVKTLTLRQMARHKARSLLITSPVPDEGKSILAWNLAAGFARSEYRVLFIDANLTNPGIHEHLKVPAPMGLGEVLRGERNLSEVVLQTPVANLYCLAAGHADEAARRGLDQAAIARLLDQARRQFDYVVVDTCSIAETADPLCLAQRVDAALVSLRTFRSRVPAADEAMRQLAALGTPVLGVVLTDPTLTDGEV